MNEVNSYYCHRRKGWIVELAETIFDPDEKIARKTASNKLALYAAVQGFDSIYLDRLDELKNQIEILKSKQN